MDRDALKQHLLSRIAADIEFLRSQNCLSASDVDFVRSRLEIGLEPTPSLASPAAVQTPRAVPTTPKPLGQAKALWSYQKTQPDDLAFVAGDTIDILEETNADWWRGSCSASSLILCD